MQLLAPHPSLKRMRTSQLSRDRACGRSSNANAKRKQNMCIQTHRACFEVLVSMNSLQASNRGERCSAIVCESGACILAFELTACVVHRRQVFADREARQCSVKLSCRTGSDCKPAHGSAGRVCKADGMLPLGRFLDVVIAGGMHVLGLRSQG